MQVNVLRHDLPQLLEKIKPATREFQQWIASGLGVSVAAQNEWWQQMMHNLGNSTSSILQSTITATAGGLVTLLLIPVFAVLLLYNREVFVQFLKKLTGYTPSEFKALRKKSEH